MPKIKKIPHGAMEMPSTLEDWYLENGPRSIEYILALKKINGREEKNTKLNNRFFEKRYL